ncbi:MAG: nucleotidyl transferase AbiEii/AbiGii toxin family protein [Myxococcales bacterium]|nr:nucleotidyl transferase AbiEii/AbiGii toxin family protein [Myxococcales bacterium]MCB9576298.1 nucleotidyl transferase AbiEii/AbiGii toxin family protein [Polyangiaceae bacterium]
MASSPQSSLTPLQQALLSGFFARERRFFLTGGGALAGYYFGHRTTEDIDLFTPPGPTLEEASQVLQEAASEAGATLEPQRTFPEFRRLLARRGDETCIVDLVIDRAPIIDDDKPVRDGVRVDSLREIAANKLCAVIGRAEIKDLVDLQVLLTHGIELGAAVLDAEKKDAGADPATIAWVVSQIKIGPDALLPGNADPIELDRFRTELVERLQVLAYERTGRTRD